MTQVRPSSPPRPHARAQRLAIAVASTCAGLLHSGAALAFEFDTGNPDLSVRWDNTPRLNFGMRVEKRNDLIGNNQLYDEGTCSFNRGDMVDRHCCASLGADDAACRSVGGGDGDAAVGGRVPLTEQLNNAYQ